MTVEIRRLVSVGNVVVDVTTHVGRLPPRGGDVLAESADVTPGGSFNTLVAAVRQGLPSAYGGAHGTGPFGDLVRARLRDNRIEILVPATPAIDTGFDVVVVDGGGERTFVTAFGAEATLSASQVMSLDIRPGDAIHVSGYGLLDRTNAAVILPWLPGLGHGHVVLLDPGPMAASIPSVWLREVLDRADWVSRNGHEAYLLTGIREPVLAAEALAAYGCGVVVRLGANGCLVSSAGQTEAVAGFAVPVVDTNGAGDAHVGAFLASLSKARQPIEAARRANACAALAVTRRGPARAPSAEEVDAFLASA